MRNRRSGLCLSASTQLPDMLGELRQQFSGTRNGKLVRLPDLLVVEFAVRTSELGDPGTVAQSQEEALALSDAERLAVRDSRDVAGVDADLLGDATDQEGTDVVGICHLDQMIDLNGGAKDQTCS